jgi:predicted RNase H-like nuclease
VRRVAGVDGCRLGWVVASLGGVKVVASFDEVLAERFDLVLIDVPIGLPGGPRACDLEARAMLGPRRSSVFPAPSRGLLRARRYAGQCSIQLWNILYKIREVDEAMTPRVQRRVREAHPECSFKLLEGAPLRFSKKTAAGEAQRRALLEPHFGRIESVPGAARDDVLDAYALLWSARRASAGSARALGDGARDSRGLRCEIVG